jgi:hypothetical protein
MSAKSIIAATMTALPEEMAGIERDWPEIERLGLWSIRKLDHTRCFATAICGFKGSQLREAIDDLRHLDIGGTLILLGCCGALTPSLSLYDPVLAEGHTTPDGSLHLPTSNTLTDSIGNKLSIDNKGWFASSERVLATSKQKQECAESCGAIAVEMEGLTIAQHIAFTDLSFASVRWVLDEMTEQISKEKGGIDLPGLTSETLFARLEEIANRISACIPLLLGG